MSPSPIYFMYFRSCFATDLRKILLMPATFILLEEPVWFLTHFFECSLSQRRNLLPFRGTFHLEQPRQHDDRTSVSRIFHVWSPMTLHTLIRDVCSLVFHVPFPLTHTPLSTASSSFSVAALSSLAALSNDSSTTSTACSLDLQKDVVVRHL